MLLWVRCMRELEKKKSTVYDYYYFISLVEVMCECDVM